MKAVYLKNFRKGLATNSSSTHSLIYKNDGELFEDLNVFELDYYDRCTRTIAASRDAKIKYILACIMYDEFLVETMSNIYPEMKQYFPTIKKTMTNPDDDDYFLREDGFGVTYRGELTFKNNTEATVKYLCNVIDNPDIVIIGGSDEEDFVYDRVLNHTLCPDPDMISGDVQKNGNYYIGFAHRYISKSDKIKDEGCGRIRFTTEKDVTPIPEYPELIDLKITNKCEHGCKFCFMNATTKGKHADIRYLITAINSLPKNTEFSIGGGNVLLYPKLDELLTYMKNHDFIVNVTVRVEDLKKIAEKNKLNKLFREKVDGLGVSVETIDDIDALLDFRDNVWKTTDKYPKQKYIVAHIIPEYLGAVVTKQIIEKVDHTCLPVLFLGYKTNGRGKTQDHVVFTNDELRSIFNNRRSILIDTTFANRYLDWIKANYSYEHSITTIEGEYSMYIDGVTQNAYKSSYELDNPYPVGNRYNEKHDYVERYSVHDAFAEIRRDNGLKAYDDIKGNHYYDKK